MKQIAKFLIGSRAFFDSMPGFTPKDSDYMYIMDTFGPLRVTALRIKMDGNDLVLNPHMTKRRCIEDTLNSDTKMRMGKFFVPEFAKYMNLTINDLKVFEKYLDMLPDNHKYYKVIYDAYMQNGDFTLTDDQRKAAYEEYKKYRNT